MSKEVAESMLKQRVIDITKTFPAQDGDKYLELAWNLFRAGVYRIPIIGIKDGSSITTLMLVSNKIQEHAQLGQEIGINPSGISYTASIEGLPSDDPDPSLFYLKIISTKNEAYQRFGTGSDFYSPPLTGEGIKELSRIFINIGVIYKFK